MSQNYYSSTSQGSGRRFSTGWSAWDWDTRGYWVSSRRNSQGVVEHKYEYPKNAQATGGSAAAESSSKYYADDAISQSQSDLSYNDRYKTSGAVDPTYSSTGQYGAIPRSVVPQAGTANYQPAYSTPGNSYKSAPTHSYDDLGRDLQNLSLEPVVSSTGNEYDNDEYTLTGGAPGAPPGKHITKASDGANKEVLDPRYSTVGYEFWKVGRVFMMLWTEPAGIKAQRGGTKNYSHISETWLSEKAYSEIRRFVVVKDDHGNCSCLAIHTYSGWATLKNNLPDPDNHAIIYTTKSPPAPYTYKDEASGYVYSENLLKDPIRVISERTDKDGMLDPKSRINYTKTYTVEKDVRVLNIGMVDKKSMVALMAASPFKHSGSGSRRHRGGR
ncbi:heterokaryon incompatibility protein [Rutstroemia sp. NJR-2017a WRK4]|nr:heterokaryon incompatibility protein [Rutstroemia sp. NJR-2017a WRK4]